MITTENANNFNGYFISQMNSEYSIYSRQKVVQSYSDYWYVSLLTFRGFHQSHCLIFLTSPTVMIQATIYTSLNSSTTPLLVNFTETRQSLSISLALVHLPKLIPALFLKNACMMKYQEWQISIPTGTHFQQLTKSCSQSQLMSNLPINFPLVFSQRS